MATRTIASPTALSVWPVQRLRKPGWRRTAGITRRTLPPGAGVVAADLHELPPLARAGDAELHGRLPPAAEVDDGAPPAELEPLAGEGHPGVPDAARDVDREAALGGAGLPARRRGLEV